MATLLVALGTVHNANAYSTDDLETSGWEKVTELTDVGQYYYVLVDAGTSQYVVTHGASNKTDRPVYYELFNPMVIEGEVWKLNGSNNVFSMQSILDDYYFSSGSAGWNDYMSQTETDALFTFTISDGKYSIVSNSTNSYVGPWNNDGSVSLSGDHIEEVAANKSAQQAPGFYIYRMARSTYEASRTNLVSAGWTLVEDAEGLGLPGYYYIALDASENGILSGYAMTGTNGRPIYTVLDNPLVNKTQLWTTEAHGSGYAFRNMQNNKYIYSAASWNMQATDDINTNHTDYIPNLIGNGRWTLSNSISTGEFVGTYSNTNYQPFNEEGLASNKAANAGKRQFVFFSIPTIAGVAIPIPTDGTLNADQWYYFTLNNATDCIITSDNLADVVYVTDGTLVFSEVNNPSTFSDSMIQLEAGTYYIKSNSAQSFSILPVEIEAAPEGQMNVDVKSALNSAYATWETTKNSATYNAVLEAIAAANQSIELYQQINVRLALLTAANQRGGLTEEQVKAMSFYTKYNDGSLEGTGTYTSLDQVVAEYKTNIANYWATNAPADGADLTAFIVNQGFEFGDLTGWDLPQGESGGAGSKAITNGDHGPESASEGVYYYSSWWTGKPVQQVLGDLPNGTYRLSAKFATNDTNDEHTVYLYANDRNIATTHEANTFGTWKDAESLVFIVTDGTATIGAVGGKQDNSFDVNNPWIFFNADNFRLTYVSSGIDVDVELPTGQMNVDVKAAMNAANEAYLASKTLDNYNALLAAIDAANQSIVIYQQIDTYRNAFIRESQRGDISENDMKAMAFYTKYSDGSLEGTGTYTSLDEIMTEYVANVKAYWANTGISVGSDITALVVNNSFETGDANGWIYSGDGDSGARRNDNPTYTTNGADGDYVFNTWEGNNGFRWMMQDITDLPAGTYEVTALFAASNDKTITFTAENVKDDAVTRTSEVEITDNSQTEGKEVSVQVVITDGRIRIGAHNGGFFKVDNYRLKYVSDEALSNVPELENGPMNADIRTAQQNAFDTWNANKSIENYNALLEAIENAKQSEAKYVIINERIPKLAAQSGGIDVTALTTKYNDGEYVEADDVFTAYHDIVKEALANPADGTDMTPFIINPSFEFANGDGWEYNTSGDTGIKQLPNDTYNMSNSDGSYLFNTWSGNGAENLHIAQLLTDLKAGTYELTATFATYNDYTVNFTAGNIHGETTDEEKLSFMPKDTDGTYGPETGLVKTIRFYVSDGNLMIGANANGFFKVDNFQLKYISNTIDLVDTNQPMNQYERGYYLDALNAYNNDPSSENLHQLLKYKLIAENSINAYKAVRATFDRVISMMSKTNVYTFDAYFTIDDMYRKYGPEEGFYRYETLEDDVAYDLERMFFGAGHYRNYVDPFSNPPDLTWMGDIPAVPFIASAWDCGFDGYAYRYKEELELPEGGHWQEGDDYYANTWSTEGIDDGTNMLNPYLEYWLYGDQLLAPKTMTATVDGTPGKEYTVKMFVRVRTIEDNQQPQGMSIQIGDGEPVVPNWQYVDNSSSYYVLNNMYRLWVCNLWDYAEEDLPKGYVDQDGKLRIKFIMEPGETNITWLSFKDVYVNYDGEDLTQALADLQTEVDYAKTNFVNYLGFDPEEYAPYTNVDELIAYKRAEQVHDASENYFLVKAAHDKLYEYNHGGENGEGTWTKNPCEMNGFYWTSDYSKDDVQHVVWYEYEDDCITPKGWDLIGRPDGFSTGISKLGVNTDAEGMKAIADSTGLVMKYETDYGNETGYTLPLKKGVKYILTFTCAYAGDGTCPPTRISLSAPRTGVQDVLDEPLTITEITPVGTSVDDQANWYMYRATFVPHFDADYVLLFDKDNVDPEPIVYGELTLVRYYDKDEADANNNKADYIVDGDSHDFAYALDTPHLEGRTVKITRTFQKGTYTSLVLPFKLSETELKEALGENFDGNVYFYTGAERTDTPGYDYYQLKFETRQTGVFANVPILFFNNAETPVNDWTDKVFNKMVTKHVENNLTIDAEPFDFIGTYQTMKIPNGGWYLKNNEFRKSSGKANLSPTCAYFIPFDTEGEPILGAKLMGFSIDDTPTGIIAIEEDGNMTVTSGNIYTIDGRLVRQNATSLEGLEPGTYIVDGKKYIIR